MLSAEARLSAGARISAEADFRVEFYDVDSMRVAWHGSYPRFFELGRCALLDKIGYGYDEMEASGYSWPVVDMRIKYLRPLLFKQRARVRATLIDYENRIHLGFLIYDPATREEFTKGSSVQMAIDMKKSESLFACPECFLSLVRAALERAAEGRGEALP
jgi:acyl-CoA thioester hydrolase